MDKTELTWYTATMPRGPKPKPKETHLQNVGLKVLPEVKQELLDIVSAEKRKEGDLARLLFMRGLEAYREDSQLFGTAGLHKGVEAAGLQLSRDIVELVHLMITEDDMGREIDFIRRYLALPEGVRKAIRNAVRRGGRLALAPKVERAS